MATTERAILAGGCFWGMQDLVRKMNGVISTRVGYSGGSTPNATYATVKTGATGHAEALEVVFDPTRMSFRQLLEFFFQIMTRPPRTGRAVIAEVSTVPRSSSPVTSSWPRQSGQSSTWRRLASGPARL